MTLTASFLKPVLAAEPYLPSQGVASYQVSTDGLAVAEVFARVDGSWGFRFAAWVAWRDAGGEVRAHSWESVHPTHALVTDRFGVAADEATRYGASRGVTLKGTWIGLSKSAV